MQLITISEEFIYVVIYFFAEKYFMKLQMIELKKN